MKHHKNLNAIAFVLLIIGGLNWGLVGLFDMDVIAMIFGEMTSIARLIYVLIGLGAVYKLVMWLQTRGK